MRKKIPKRIISILLLFTMILTSVPAYALEGNGSGVGDNVPGSTNGTYNWDRNKQGYRITILDSTGKPVSNSVDFLFSKTGNAPGIYMTSSKVEALSTSEKNWTKIILDNDWLEKEGIKGISLDPFTNGHFPRAIVADGSGFHANGVKVKGFLLNGDIAGAQSGRQIVNNSSLGVGTGGTGGTYKNHVSTSNTGLKNEKQLTGKDNNHS